jgi:shikimate kinase
LTYGCESNVRHPQNLFLVGPMGAGKSAVGRQLARLLHLEFVDSDQEIESRTGVDIPFIFEKEGEAGFRKREAGVIDDLSRKDGIVLATGGGAIMDPENRNHLGARGFVIYLHTSVEQQLARTRKGRDRPLLEKDDPRAVLETLMAAREPLYREIADLTVDTDGRKVRAVANEILDRL